MERSYTNNRSISVVEADGDPSSMRSQLHRHVEESLPGCCFVIAIESRGLIVPPTHKVLVDGRGLRGEEYPVFEKAIETGVQKLGTQRVLWAVEEIYTLEWDSFRGADWRALAGIYARLPQWMPDADLPRWFSLDEAAQHLWASVEPPGLQVAGLVQSQLFDEWHRRFLALTADLPFRAF